MSRVQYIHRVDTRDGKPTRQPTTVEDKDSFHYTATYNFWGMLPQ